MECSYWSFRRFLRENGCEREFDAAFYEQCGANVLDETLADISYEELRIQKVFNPSLLEMMQDSRHVWWRNGESDYERIMLMLQSVK